MKKIKDLNISGNRVILRADLDVPLTDVGYEEAATRLTNLVPTINHLFNENASIVIIGHIGRPKKSDTTLSTKQLLDPLQKILKRTIVFKEDFTDDSVDVPELKSQITLFENLRFWPGEIVNDDDFTAQLATLGDFYINDAFGNSHRSHASMIGLPKLLASAPGKHLEKEIEELSRVLKNPEHPLISIVGGAKIETKLPVIQNLSKLSDFVLVGGELPVEIARLGSPIPDNVIVAKLTHENKEITDDSVEKFVSVIKNAKMVVWNGPQGLFEEGYNHGTLSVAKAIIESGAHSVVGGGETTQFLEQNKLLSKFSFVSAGGGAMLEFLSGKKLPALDALEKSSQ